MLFVAMKKSRACLQIANDLAEKKQCVKAYVATKIVLAIEEEEYAVFDNVEQTSCDRCTKITSNMAFV